MKSRYSTSGFSLIEILLVVGIIAVLAIAAFVIYPRVQAASKAKHLQEEVLLIHTGLWQFDRGRFYQISANDAAKGNIVPPYLWANHPQFWKSKLGSDIYFSWTTVAGKPAWTLQYRDIPSDVCVIALPSMMKTKFSNIRIVGGGTIREGASLQTLSGQLFACNLGKTLTMTFTLLN